MVAERQWRDMIEPEAALVVLEEPSDRQETAAGTVETLVLVVLMVVKDTHIHNFGTPFLADENMSAALRR